MPSFGRDFLQHWLLDPDITYLNHGTLGAPPSRVLAAQQAIRDAIERQPAQYLLRELSGAMPMPWRAEGRLREAMRPIAAFVGADADDLVFVSNVTVGLNAVLQSYDLRPGDEVVVADLAYGAIANAARYAAARAGAAVRTLVMPFPIRDRGVVVAAIRDALGPRTRLLVIDHITAMTALVLPIAEISALCRAAGVPVLVDGAHVPGAIDLDIPSLEVDWYAANLHKWAHAPRPCGILWAQRDRQPALHHPVVSWGLDRGFHAEFDWNGTFDPSPWLAAPEGVAALEDWGWPAVRDYVHDLAWTAGAMLGRRWQTTVEAPRDMIGAMVTVPLPDRAGSTDADADRVRLALLTEARIEVQLQAWRGRLWVRVSAQVYNDPADVERLGVAVDRLLR
ncbi:MAG: aminotransferase class V-fold PLP-dependent enzyme [Acidobacteria bacterium]|nr:aminotransferase class V-fold PLP-dependent enzyme [Acidobacteriota bacterium]